MFDSETPDLKLVRRWYEQRDPAIWSDDVEWILPEGFPHGGHLKGKTQIFEEFFPKLRRDWSDWRADCAFLFDSGDYVVGGGTYRATCNATQKPLEARFVHLFRVTAGRVDLHISYVDAAAFLAAQTRETP